MKEDTMDLVETLRPHIRYTAAIGLDPAKPNPIHPGRSRLGGNPDLGPVGGCQNCGTPLRFVCQFNGADFAHVELPFSFFDFHYCFACMPWKKPGDGDAATVFRSSGKIPDHAAPGKTRLISLRGSGACLPVRDGANTLMVSDPGIPFDDDMTLDDPSYMQMWTLYEQALDKLEAWPVGGSFVGGYPVWIQGDDTPVSPASGNRMRLLAQIDTKLMDDTGLAWGDAGAMYLFIDSPRTFGFVVQCC